MSDIAEKKTNIPVGFLVPIFIFLMASIPMSVAVLPMFLLEPVWAKVIAAGIAPIIFSLGYTTIAALFSLPFKKAIITGKFPRDISHFVYGPRRLYSLCWCAVFYFTPVYFALMSIPPLRTLFLRAFGYRGHSNISIAPDAWIRDLPLLKFESGVYVANKATIGTNICLADGNILVGTITLKEKAMIGHMTMIAPGTQIGKETEIGVGCAIGIRVNMGDQVRIGPTASLNHGCRLGNKVSVGPKCYIGLRASIAEGIRIPPGTNIPDGASVKTQSDVEKYISSENKVLSDEKERLENIFVSRNQKIKTETLLESI